jgi:hypothetical protein
VSSVFARLPPVDLPLPRLVQLGSKAIAAEGELDDEDGPAQSLAIYREHFEVPFLKASRTYYTAEADVFLSQHPMIDYIKRVRRWRRTCIGYLDCAALTSPTH